MVSTTEAVTARDGSGLWTEPHAHIAPEMIPSSGGRRVNGRVRVIQFFTTPDSNRQEC